MQLIPSKPFLAASLLVSIFSVTAFNSTSPVSAQTYQTWQNPDAPTVQNDPAAQTASDERLKGFVDKLNTMIDKAEQDSAADPVFLRDLRDLANGYDRPWSLNVLFDDFADGNYDKNPNWNVSVGRYFVEKGWGLRNAIDKPKATSSGSSNNDAASILLGKILNKALGGSSTSGSGTSAPTLQPTAIFSNTPISNAFSIEVDVSSWVNEGNFIIGPYQGSKRDIGYRLSYTVGGAIELMTASTRGVRTLDVKQGPFKLEDQKVHKIQWTRGGDGMMIISLDGKKLFEVLDRSFRDPFNGFGMATNGGDFIVKQVSIHATP
jgi:hypothetical protein